MKKYIPIDHVVRILLETLDKAHTTREMKMINSIFNEIKKVDCIDIERCEGCENYLNNHLCLHWSRHGTIETNNDDFCSYGKELIRGD